NVEAQPLGGCAEFREQTGKLVRGQVPAIRGCTLRHARYVRQRVENSFGEIRIGIDAAVGERSQDVALRWDTKPKLSSGKTRRHGARVHEHIHDPNPGDAIGEAVVQAENEPAALTLQPVYQGQVP